MTQVELIIPRGAESARDEATDDGGGWREFGMQKTAFARHPAQQLIIPIRLADASTRVANPRRR